jgi:adenylyltransferase/sulfurtransferase
MEAPYAYDRYQRQLILKGFGVEAQDKLRRGRVLVIGAGGLGCPIIQYLVAAGVGHIGVADPDKVSVSNLHRQILFGADDIGAWKADVVRQKMQRLDPDAQIIIWKEQWMHPHCLEFFPQYDVVVDATDNFASRYMINDAAVLTGKPLVFGAVSQYEGQVAVFNCPTAEGGRSVHYRDLFPDPPQDGEVLNCSEGGVLGVLPGIIGCLQAAEVIKLLTGIGTPLANQLLTYQLLTQSFFTLQLSAHPMAGQQMPGSAEAFLATDYVALCDIARQGIREMTVEEWRERRRSFLLVDVREPHEQPRLGGMCSAWSVECEELPLSSFSDQLPLLAHRDLVLVCKAGRRSLLAASIIANKRPDIHVFSLKGGVDALIESQMV